MPTPTKIQKSGTILWEIGPFTLSSDVATSGPMHVFPATSLKLEIPATQHTYNAQSALAEQPHTILKTYDDEFYTVTFAITVVEKKPPQPFTADLIAIFHLDTELAKLIDGPLDSFQGQHKTVHLEVTEKKSGKKLSSGFKVNVNVNVHIGTVNIYA